MSYQVLARKWRPASFDQVVGQEHVLKALTHALEQNRLHHAYLFTGTRGVGKTSIARLLAKGLNCEQGITATPCGQCSHCQEISQGRFVDLLEIDAASRTKVDDTREILDNVQYQPVRGRFKVYLIDEVHMLSRHSFNALLKTLEEPPPHVKFLLATTDPQKLPVTVLSRCLQFNLKSVTPNRITQHLARVLSADGVAYDEPALQLLAQAADGSVRDSLSLTDQAIAHGGGQVQLASVQAMLGTLDTGFALRLVHGLCQGKVPELMAVLDEVEAFAPDHDELLRQILALLHQVALAQFNARASGLSDQAEAILDLAQSLDREQVQLWYQMLAQGRQDLTLAPDPRSGLEMVLLRALAFAPVEAAPPMAARQPRMRTPVQPVADTAEHSTPAIPVVAPKPEPTPIVESRPIAAPEPVAEPRAHEPTPVEAPAEPEAGSVAATPEKGEPATKVDVPAAKAGVANVEPRQAQAEPAPAAAAPEPEIDPQMASLMAMDQEEAALASEQEFILGQAASFGAEPPMPSSPAEPAAKPTPTATAATQGGFEDLLSQALANRKGLEARRTQITPKDEGTSDPKTQAVTSPVPAAPKAAPKPEAVPEPVAAVAPADVQAKPQERPPWDPDLSEPPNLTGMAGHAEAKPEPEAEPQAVTAPAPEPAPAQTAVAADAPPAPAESRPVASPHAAPGQAADVDTLPEGAPGPALDLAWYRTIAQLGIGARPRQLAINSVLEREGEAVRLRLIDEQRHLNHPSVIGPLKEKMEALWGHPVQLEIVEAGTPGRETPLQIRRRLHQERLDQAKVDLLADPAVQWLQSELGAQLIDASVSYQHTD